MGNDAGEEILYFYQPDEDLKLEDVFPDIEGPTPEQLTETKQLRSYVRTSLSTMPPEWRRTFLLHHLVGLTPSQLARASGTPEREVNATLERGREYVRQKLIEYGCSIRRGEGAPIRAATSLTGGPPAEPSKESGA